MSYPRLQLRELEPRLIALSQGDAEFLRGRHAGHLDLSPMGSGDEWLAVPRHVCGIIPLPSGTIVQIEPKVPIESVWHMLAFAWDLAEPGLPVRGDGVTGLLDALLACFVRELRSVIGHGLMRSYASRRANLPLVRGRLDIWGQLRLNPGVRDRFLCIFEELGPDTPENRVLLAALEVAHLAHSRDARLGPAIRTCRTALTGVRVTTLSPLDLARACAPVGAGHYCLALALARLILEGCVANHRPGSRLAPALLVEMPRLFERFVCAVLGRGLGPGIQARSAGHAISLDEHKRALLAPDVMIEGGGTARCVVDAKYKLAPSARADPSTSDLYQMLAYCVGYRVPDAILVYPEPCSAPPFLIDRAPWRARIHTFGLVLSGDWASVRAQCDALCDHVAAIADGEGARASGGIENCAIRRALGTV